MTNTYVWSVQSLPTSTQSGHDDFVCLANWLCTATDGVNTASIPGTSTFELDNKDTYIARADLTEAQVLAWVWEKTKKADIEAYLDTQLTVTTPPLPWSN